MNDVWALVHAEREALIDLLESLRPELWERDSLLPGWTVHDVVAHLVDTAKTTRLGFVLGLARARFDFDRQNEQGIARERGATPEETLRRFRAVRSRTSTPPAPLDTRLVEAVVHGEDIRRPLGQVHAYQPESVRRALEVQARTPTSFGGGKELLAGLSVRAVDTDFDRGAGPLVAGPALALLMLASGRSGYLADVEGPGVEQLAFRLETT